jgi:translation elongation factor EF-1alpha
MIINTVTLLGHKDHGKSTLIGSMLMHTGSATKVRINEAKMYSKRLGKAFEPAFILDSFSEEREGGLTIDTTRAQIKYKDSAFELIDVPGHEELIKNMISGASYAKFAILLVSAKKDEGIRPQTKRHLFLAKMLGISNFIIAVNKMDTVKYSEHRFEVIREELLKFLEKIGIEGRHVQFVPISAYTADNLTKNSKNIRWYTGKPLLEIMRAMANHKDSGSSDGNIRIILQGSMPHETDSLLIGNVASGEIKIGSNVKIVPQGIYAMVNSLFVKGSRKRSAKEGENVAIKLDKLIKTDTKGSVMYNQDYAKGNSANKFNALIFITKAIKGKVIIKFNGMDIKGTVKIKKLIDTTNGLERGAKGAQQLNAANAEIKLESKIPAEPFSVSKELGRFIIYQGDDFSGIGTITSIIGK